ncbi:hypothetical protein T296_11720 [Pantoea agglomerans Eh318]|nr:hypothetical protein T296_11720 [Pantoea agglomerans Eh318]
MKLDFFTKMPDMAGAGRYQALLGECLVSAGNEKRGLQKQHEWLHDESEIISF